MEQPRSGAGVSKGGPRYSPRPVPASASASASASENVRSTTTIEMEIRTEPVGELGEFEKAAVLTVARMMASLHYPNVAMKRWSLEEEEEPHPHYNVVTEFPSRTTFNVAQLSLVQSASPCLVSDVWVQPEADRVLLCASIRKASATGVVTVEEIHIVRRVLSEDSRKRTRVV